MRRTKIVATIGPATRNPDRLKQLIAAGVNVMRLNFSHGSQTEHGEVIAAIRAIGGKLDRPVAILQDLAGPKIRTGPIAAGRIELEPQQEFTLTGREVPGDASQVSVTYKDLPRDVSPGDTLLLSDGELELHVEEVEGDDIRCRVVIGGPLSSSKGINLITRSIRAPILTDKDRSDLAFGILHGVDYVALSFVRTAEDITQAKALMREGGRTVPVIAKIEQREAIDQIDAIIDNVDGIMIARGDLGVEIPVEEVPRVQKSIIEKANFAGIPVITATQMLKTMVEHPHPTRAEVSDVANAILDGSDAIMLSEETAVGQHPVVAVRTMARIAESTEAILPYDAWSSRLEKRAPLSQEEAVARAACQMAERIDAAAIITLTQSGTTTRLVAKYRPPCTILAMTPDQSTCCRLSLHWGTIPMHLAAKDDPDEMQDQAIGAAVESGYVKSGQSVVITAGLPLHVPGTTNTIKIAQVP
jgi:pyruvate kinase